MNTYDDNTKQADKNERMKKHLIARGIKIESSSVPDEWPVPQDMRSILLDQIWK